MKHSLLPIILVLVAVAGLVAVAVFSRRRRKNETLAERDPAEARRIQERLASSRIARRASGSRRKVVAIRPPVAEEPASRNSESSPIQDKPPADGTVGQ